MARKSSKGFARIALGRSPEGCRSTISTTVRTASRTVRKRLTSPLMSGPASKISTSRVPSKTLAQKEVGARPRYRGAHAR